MSFEETKLIAIVIGIFHVSHFSRSFRYGQVLLRYYLTDSVLFLSPLLSYSV